MWGTENLSISLSVCIVGTINETLIFYADEISDSVPSATKDLGPLEA